jgi:hypothetical protein
MRRRIGELIIEIVRKIALKKENPRDRSLTSPNLSERYKIDLYNQREIEICQVARESVTKLRDHDSIRGKTLGKGRRVPAKEANGAAPFCIEMSYAVTVILRRWNSRNR